VLFLAVGLTALFLRLDNRHTWLRRRFGGSVARHPGLYGGRDELQLSGLRARLYVRAEWNVETTSIFPKIFVSPICLNGSLKRSLASTLGCTASTSRLSSAYQPCGSPGVGQVVTGKSGGTGAPCRRPPRKQALVRPIPYFLRGNSRLGYFPRGKSHLVSSGEYLKRDLAILI